MIMHQRSTNERESTRRGRTDGATAGGGGQDGGNSSRKLRRRLRRRTRLCGEAQDGGCVLSSSRFAQSATGCLDGGGRLRCGRGYKSLLRQFQSKDVFIWIDVERHAPMRWKIITGRWPPSQRSSYCSLVVPRLARGGALHSGIHLPAVGCRTRLLCGYGTDSTVMLYSGFE